MQIQMGFFSRTKQRVEHEDPSLEHVAFRPFRWHPHDRSTFSTNKQFRSTSAYAGARLLDIVEQFGQTIASSSGDRDDMASTAQAIEGLAHDTIMGIVDQNISAFEINDVLGRGLANALDAVSRRGVSVDTLGESFSHLSELHGAVWTMMHGGGCQMKLVMNGHEIDPTRANKVGKSMLAEARHYHEVMNTFSYAEHVPAIARRVLETICERVGSDAAADPETGEEMISLRIISEEVRGATPEVRAFIVSIVCDCLSSYSAHSASLAPQRGGGLLKKPVKIAEVEMADESVCIASTAAFALFWMHLLAKWDADYNCDTPLAQHTKRTGSTYRSLEHAVDKFRTRAPVVASCVHEKIVRQHAYAKRSHPGSRIVPWFVSLSNAISGRSLEMEGARNGRTTEDDPSDRIPAVHVGDDSLSDDAASELDESVFDTYEDTWDVPRMESEDDAFDAAALDDSVDDDVIVDATHLPPPRNRRATMGGRAPVRTAEPSFGGIYAGIGVVSLIAVVCMFNF